MTEKRLEPKSSHSHCGALSIVVCGQNQLRKSLGQRLAPRRCSSCIIKRYCEKRFVSKYLATIGIDYGVTKVHVRDREIKVNIFDMAGHPFFYEVRNEFYKDTQGVILVYDVGQKDSFDALDAWLAEMKQELGPHGNMENIIFVVCANKIDCTKHRCVDESEGRLWAESKGFLYFETSAQTGEGINEMFQPSLWPQTHERPLYGLGAQLCTALSSPMACFADSSYLLSAMRRVCSDSSSL
ncbi:PREDICTED: dnaJ homolog subfamily C member 27 isoform X5 [Rhinopithecus bieti]|uniref:dnaJ homolog subfamily C member 27 isoform X5 n=1 Tax=Rhinopithecus bieti TaxID=61621 RepID=UPI00083C0E95|nr:PREDICTED: dnaJ homolog subfamily C member 27 isoform X5 [Rhinopithecus bieti]